MAVWKSFVQRLSALGNMWSYLVRPTFYRSFSINFWKKIYFLWMRIMPVKWLEQYIKWICTYLAINFHNARVIWHCPYPSTFHFQSMSDQVHVQIKTFVRTHGVHVYTKFDLTGMLKIIFFFTIKLFSMKN